MKNLTITGERGELGGYLLSRFVGTDYDHPSRLIHLAAKLPIKADPKNLAEDIIESNINFLLKTIKLAEEKGVEEFIFFSTNSIYKGQDQLGLTEETAPQVKDLYTLTKYLGEEILRNSRLKKVLCVRIGGLLEVRKSTNFLSETLQKLLREEPVTLTNANQFYNNFISREEIFQFVSNLRLSEPFDTAHLGAEPDMKLVEIVNLLKKQSNSSSPIIVSDEKRTFFNLNIEKAKKKYRFCPVPTRESLTQWVAEILNK